MTKREKKKFKKVVKWNHDGAGWELILVIPAIPFIVVPFIASIRISLDGTFKSGIALLYYAIGGIFLLIALVIYLSNLERKVYYEEL